MWILGLLTLANLAGVKMPGLPDHVSKQKARVMDEAVKLAVTTTHLKILMDVLRAFAISLAFRCRR
jgi:hypothetical protein